MIKTNPKSLKDLNMKKTLISLSLVLLISSCSSEVKKGYYKGYELPSYKITKKIGNFEFRQYEADLVAEIEVKGERKAAAREGFMTLARYIFGKNVKENKIDMTTPVAQEEVSEKISMTSPVTQLQTENKKWKIQFGMPKKYTLSTLPKPKDKRIKFKILPAKKIIALRFSSLWKDKRFNTEKKNWQFS